MSVVAADAVDIVDTSVVALATMRSMLHWKGNHICTTVKSGDTKARDDLRMIFASRVG